MIEQENKDRLEEPKFASVAVTGGAGFIGSNLLLRLVPKYPRVRFVNIDCLTYAANLSNLASIESAENYSFERVDIAESDTVRDCFARHDFDAVIHLAAESHVDRSIMGPRRFVETNVLGTFNLLESARAVMEEKPHFRFHHVSTDEVYGSLGETGYFTEESSYDPNSPYSASKAASDHLVNSYHVTYGLDTVITNCCNNYGPYQFPEKLIPLMVRNAVKRMKLPVYGDGSNVRDWLHVEDHCAGLEAVFNQGRPGETYVIGGNCEVANIDLVKQITAILQKSLESEPLDSLIEFVADRPGHDHRYAIDASKIRNELGWRPSYDFESGLQQTIAWYLDNEEWVENCVSGEYRSYYEQMYTNR